MEIWWILSCGQTKMLTLEVKMINLELKCEQKSTIFPTKHSVISLEWMWFVCVFSFLSAHFSAQSSASNYELWLYTVGGNLNYYYAGRFFMCDRCRLIKNPTNNIIYSKISIKINCLIISSHWMQISMELLEASLAWENLFFIQVQWNFG